MSYIYTGLFLYLFVSRFSLTVLGEKNAFFASCVCLPAAPKVGRDSVVRYVSCVGGVFFEQRK